MIKQWKKALSACLAAAVFGTALTAADPDVRTKAEPAAEGAPVISVPSFGLTKDRAKNLGTEENPFLVLEIVPYEGYAEIGYLVAGQEPVDFERAKYISLSEVNSLMNGVNSVVKTGSSSNAYTVIGREKYVDYYREQIQYESDGYPAGYLKDNESELCYGYFQRVADGTGKYNIAGKMEDMSLRVAYVGTGGSYDFVMEYPDEVAGEYIRNDSQVAGLSGCSMDYGVRAADVPGYKEAFEEKAAGVPLPNGTIKISHYLCEKDYFNNIYAYFKGTFGEYGGTFGRFERVWDKSGSFQLTGSVWERNISVTYCGSGGDWKFSPKDNKYIDYPNFYGEGGTALNHRPEDVMELPLSVELGAKNAKLDYRRGGGVKNDTIEISYAGSTPDQIRAKIRFYAPLEFEYSNKNYFVTHGIGMTEEDSRDYSIRVITVTPDTLEANLTLIDAADFINITDAAHVANMMDLWGKYYRESMFSPDPAELNTVKYNPRNFLANDISWEATVRLLKRISVPEDHADIAPMSFSVTCHDKANNAPAPYTGSTGGFRKHSDGLGQYYGAWTSGTINNIAKLYMMLVYFQSEEEGYFYKHFIETGLVKETTVNLNGKNVTTGYFDSFIRKYGSSDEVWNGAKYWNQYTFIQFEELGSPLNTNASIDELFRQSMLTPSPAGGQLNFSVRNNVFTYNSDCSLTQNVLSDSFEKRDDDYHREPFEIMEFENEEIISPADILYYLLHQERSSIQMLINGSNADRIFSNVSYDAKNQGETALAGEIITVDNGAGELQLYGRVRLNVSLSANRKLKDSLVEITIYRDPFYDIAGTPEREDVITFTQAYNSESGELEPIRLDTPYYYDVPLDLLATSNTEDLKFSLKVHYNYKGTGNDASTDSYSSVKKLYGYELAEDGTVKKDERRILTFVRRALFFLD